MVSSLDAWARSSDEGESIIAADLPPRESAEAGPTGPIARIALESIAATWRRFDRETAVFSIDGEYVVILPAP
jgi:hypothetical protein